MNETIATDITKEQETALRQCWRTPKDLWARIAETYRPTLDLAANRENHLLDGVAHREVPEVRK